ncbi:hypothetical protein HK405_010870, partial [Cladochytrium tenue]
MAFYCKCVLLAGHAVIGAGLGRTGTASMQLALNMLGFRCYHMYDIPIISAATYYVTVKYFNSRILARRRAAALASAPAGSTKPAPAATAAASSPSSPLFTAFVFLHNLALCVFSAACFAAVAPVWFGGLAAAARGVPGAP